MEYLFKNMRNVKSGMRRLFTMRFGLSWILYNVR